MALSPTQASICNKIKGDFDALVEPARKATKLVQQKISELKTELNNLKIIGFSPIEDINNAIKDVEEGVEEQIPETDQNAINEINNIISSCTYLGDDPLLNNPTAVLKSMSRSAFDAVQDVVNAIPLPDFTAGRLFDSLINSIANQIPDNPDDLGISDGMKKADQLIDCLNAICGPDFASTAQEYADELEDLYDKLNIVGNPASPTYGQFDVNRIYNDVGLDLIEQSKMEDIVKSVQDVKQFASDNINKAVETTKTIRKTSLQIF